MGSKWTSTGQLIEKRWGRITIWRCVIKIIITNHHQPCFLICSVLCKAISRFYDHPQKPSSAFATTTTASATYFVAAGLVAEFPNIFIYNLKNVFIFLYIKKVQSPTRFFILSDSIRKSCWCGGGGIFWAELQQTINIGLVWLWQRSDRQSSNECWVESLFFWWYVLLLKKKSELTYFLEKNCSPA